MWVLVNPMLHNAGKEKLPAGNPNENLLDLLEPSVAIYKRFRWNWDFMFNFAHRQKKKNNKLKFTYWMLVFENEVYEYNLTTLENKWFKTLIKNQLN